ncbi:MAG: response regulator transcription factor [Fusobacteriaceae bacterium]|jgi:DNA-binding response OmpR family regulator|nr:response regulator transcription factor [Fusobacteriaceae bacterium]MBP6467248.1 response regulator transcription factor [Fusobacteriaceae bacterium]MBP9595502.1 response regulator transcription factor [Fusobacteriaceae bacterium]MBU9917061.1 response regulator transcription factor [Fusobacteriaceae bacterium]
MKKILIVEDEDRMRKLVKDYLVKWGYEVVEADDGYKALEVYNKEQPDLIILDVMIPGIEGYEVAYEIKKISSVPIIMLTAKSEEYDELNGFKCGADDYVRKPFSPKILMARIEALLRYVDKFVETKEEGLVVDSSKHKVYLEGEELTLTPKEFILLNYMMKNRGLVLTREQILAAVWDFDYDGDMRTVDTHIKRVRKKLDGRFIKTIHGYGYKFQEEL